MDLAQRRLEHVMGLPVSVEIRRPSRDMASALRRAFDWLRSVDREAARAGRGELGPDDYSIEYVEILALCAEYERRSGGAFRARRTVDRTGLIRGWAVQRMAELLVAEGTENFCVNAGGNVVTRGESEPGCRWRVGVRDPERGDRMCAVFRVRDGAVATSSGRVSSGQASDGQASDGRGGLLCLTVLADDLTTAAGTAAAAFALGMDGVAWAARQAGCSVFAIDSRHRVYRSANLDGLLIP